MIQASTKIPKSKQKRILLIRLPKGIEQTDIIKYHRSTMSDLNAMYIDVETGLVTLRFHITYSDVRPLYFVRSSKYTEYYYAVRYDRCGCLEWQDCHYCQHMDNLPAIASSAA